MGTGIGKIGTGREYTIRFLCKLDTLSWFYLYAELTAMR